MEKNVKMKVALCLSGEFRFFENDYIKKGMGNFLSVLEPDLFISTWSHIGKSMNHQITNKTENKDNQDFIENYIYTNFKNIKKFELESFDFWLSSLGKNKKKIIDDITLDYRTINSLPQLYKIEKCNLLKKEFELENNFKYDVVIRSRFDNLFVDELDLSFVGKSNIYNINLGGNFYPNRVYDIMFYGDSISMDIISETYSNIGNLIDDNFSNGLCKRDTCRLLFLQSIKNNLNVFSTNNRPCDVYRGTTFEEYYNYLKKLGGVIN
jgi:hypothetical protein